MQGCADDAFHRAQRGLYDIRLCDLKTLKRAKPDGGVSYPALAG